MRAKDRYKLLTGMGFERGAAYVQTNAAEQSVGNAEEQVHRISDWAGRHQSQVQGWFVDLGVDGNTDLAERAGWAQLVEVVQRGEADFVVVTGYGRLGRSPELILDAIQQLVQLKVLVVVIDGEASQGQLMAMEQVETVELRGHVSPEETLN